MLRGDQRGDDPGGGGTYQVKRIALVMLVQEPGGGLEEIRLHRSSGSPAFDRAALDAARTLAEGALEAPPDGSTTIWAFEASLRITPPAPIVGCSFDAGFIPQECFYPMSRHLKHGVKLLGVWHEGETPGLR